MSQKSQFFLVSQKSRFSEQSQSSHHHNVPSKVCWSSSTWLMSLVFSSISAWFSRSPGQVNISRQKRTSPAESGAGSAVPSHHRLSSWWSTRPRLWNAGLRCEGTLPEQETERGSQRLPEALWNTRRTAAGSTHQVLDSPFTFTQPRTQPFAITHCQRKCCLQHRDPWNSKEPSFKTGKGPWAANSQRSFDFVSLDDNYRS